MKNLPSAANHWLFEPGESINSIRKSPCAANLKYKKNLYNCLRYISQDNNSPSLNSPSLKSYLKTFNFGPDTDIRDHLYNLLIKYNVKVCGGSVVNYVLNLDVTTEGKSKVNYKSDMDLLFPDEPSLLSFKEEFWKACFSIRGMATVETNKSFTIKILDSIGLSHVIVQLIRVQFKQTVEELVDHFDINICKMGIECSIGKLYISPEAKLDVINERLSLTTGYGALSFNTLFRIKKYSARFGYNPELAIRQYLTLLSGNEFKTYEDLYSFQNPSAYEIEKVKGLVYLKGDSDKFNLKEFRDIVLKNYLPNLPS